MVDFAEANRASIRTIKEVVWGTTPASGSSKALRFTESSLVASKETKVSEEIRADRMVPSIAEVGASSGGSLSGEFSAGTYDDFFEAFLLGAWTKAMNFVVVKGATVSITSTSVVRLSGADYTNLIAANQWIKLEGFQTPGNNGYFQVASRAFSGGNTNITVSGTPLTVEAGSPTTKLLDASDVILVSTTTSLDAGNEINGGGSNAFAGQTLRIGQRIYLEGLGKETGTIVCETTDPGEGDTVTVSDGVDTVIFEIRTDASLVDSNHIHVALSGTEATLAANIAAAVNAKFALGELRVTATVSTATITFTNHRLDGGSLAASDDGSSVTVTNFSGGDTTKGGFFTIAALPDDDTIVTEETLGTDANGGGLTVVIKGSHLRNSGELDEIVKQSFTIETGFGDVAKYFVMTGMRVGSFSKQVSVGEIVSVEFELMGKETTAGVTDTLGNSPYTALPTTSTEVLNATSNVGTVKKDGVALTVDVMSIEMEGDANLRERRAVGKKFPGGIGYGRFSLNGKITAYFASLDFYNDFINHETVALEYDFTDTDNNYYVWRVPALKITSDPISPTGIDTDVMEEMDWTAQRDPVLNTQLMIDRFSSIYPMSDA